MVIMSDLDLTFQALADPTRRAILTRLRCAEAVSLSDLAAPFEMSLPGVMKHVGILEMAGLIEREKIGRTVFCKLNGGAMTEAIGWLQEMESFWSARMDALALLLDAEATPADQGHRAANTKGDKQEGN